MASAASHNNIDLSLRCQVTHASGVAALGCGRSKSPRLPALASVDVRLPHWRFHSLMETLGLPRGWSDPSAPVIPSGRIPSVSRSWESCMGLVWERELYTSSGDTQLAACLCVRWFWVRKIVRWGATLWCPYVFQHYLPCRFLSLFSSLFLSLGLTLAPYFIRTRRPGRKCFWIDSRAFHFGNGSATGSYFIETTSFWLRRSCQTPPL